MPARYYYLLVDKQTKLPVATYWGCLLILDKKSTAQRYQQANGGSKHIAIKPIKIDELLKHIK